MNRTATPWIIVTCHRMMVWDVRYFLSLSDCRQYTTQLLQPLDYIVSLHLRKALDAVLYKYQVNLMLVGHQHSYERSCQVFNSTCTNDGTGAMQIKSHVPPTCCQAPCTSRLVLPVPHLKLAASRRCWATGRSSRFKIGAMRDCRPRQRRFPSRLLCVAFALLSQCRSSF